MFTTIVADISSAAAGLWEFLRTPVVETAWGDWRGFWLGQIFDDRFLVCYFLPLVPILLLLARRHLRVGIVVTGLVFLAYVFGVAYAALWLGMCVAFYHVSERFAIEAKRTDVLQIGPPLAAIGVVGGWWLVTMLLHKVPLPTELNAWLYEHVRWVFPLGARGWSWEPGLLESYLGPEARGPVPLMQAIFWVPHNIGVAYFTMRMLHYFSELKRDTIPQQRRSLLNFLAYVCYAPGLMQGPLERYDRFHDEMNTCHQRRSWRNLPPGLARIGWGLFKGLIATWYFLPVLKNDLIGGGYYTDPAQIGSYALLYFGIYIHIFWLYLEFSGYCDVSAGIARLLGYRQVENFNWCWLATSLRDFWRRWHISLSFLIRDYVYIPLGGNRRHVTLNLVVTFGLVGIWHGLSFRLLLWGVVMGLMIAVNQRWARWIKKLDERPTGRLPARRRAAARVRPLPQILSWALTMHFFVHSLLIFFGGSGAWRVTWELIRRPLEALAGP
jgi:D-alanyl-lipoteichoic acid acyltransferase DltB (MBOAT superfamily)